MNHSIHFSTNLLKYFRHLANMISTTKTFFGWFGRKLFFTFRKKKKLLFSMTTLSTLCYLISMLKVIIYTELSESKSSHENFKSILIWNGFTKYPIHRRGDIFSSVLHSHWSRNIEARLSLVESFIVLLRHFSYAIKNQLVASKAPY